MFTKSFLRRKDATAIEGRSPTIKCLSRTTIKTLTEKRDPCPSALESGTVRTNPSISHATMGEPNWPTEWKAYTSLASCFFLMANSWGLVNAYGTFSSYHNDHLLPGKDILLWNLVGSTESAMILFLSFLVGRVLDAGYVRQCVGIGTILTGLALFMLSVCSGGGGQGEGNYLLIWLLQGPIQGFGMAFFFVTSSQVAVTWFTKKKAFAVGVVASGASISGLIYPIMFKELVSKTGYNNAIRYVAGLAVATMLFSFFFCIPNPKHPFRKPKKWATLQVWWDSSAFTVVSYRWYVASISWLFFGFYAIFFNLEEWAAHTGLGRKDNTPIDISLPNETRSDAIRTFYLLAIMNGSSTIGRLSSAWMSDHYGALNVHIITTFISGMLVILMWPLTKSTSAAIAFVVVFGAFSGSVIGLPPASVSWILEGMGRKHISKLGQWVGMMYSIAGLAALTGPIIAGHLISEFGNNYLTVQLWSGICLLLSALCMAIARWTARKMRPFTMERIDHGDGEAFDRHEHIERRNSASESTSEIFSLDGTNDNVDRPRRPSMGGKKHSVRSWITGKQGHGGGEGAGHGWPGYGVDGFRGDRSEMPTRQPSRNVSPERLPKLEAYSTRSRSEVAVSEKGEEKKDGEE